ncbi:MAG: hypothetical protein IJW15_03920 [Clostridia bacterium]|nr:hypothetical protein [Clostridia bacterium]
MSNAKKEYISKETEIDEKANNAWEFDEDEMSEMRLFPDEFAGSTASATECTGLIQVAPVTPELQETYDSVYSYRKKQPVKEETEE